MHVSVIMAAYNGARFIAESIASVLGQTFTELELIVVDDGSTDETAAVVRSVADERIVYLHQPNGRQGMARNNGIRHARGEWIAFLDQDDLWLPDKLARQLAAVERAPADVVFSDGFLFSNDPSDEREPLGTISGHWDGEAMLRLLFTRNRIAVLSTLVRKDWVHRVGLMTEADDRQGCDDYDLWMRLAAAGASFLGMPDRLVRYRSHEGQQSRDTPLMLAAELTVVEGYLHHPLVDRRLAAPRLRSLYGELVDALVARGRIDEAKRWLRRQVRHERRALAPLAALSLFPSLARRHWSH